MDNLTYTLVSDPQDPTRPIGITCHTCRRTSYNLNDVEHRYCGHCRQFHDDLRPALVFLLEMGSPLMGGEAR